MTREEAIKIIDCYDINFYDLSGEKIPAYKLAEAFDMAIEALSAEADWIPCSERLPEDGVAVLTTTENEEVYIDQVITDPYQERYFLSNTAYDNFQVIAWMPLPKPYREDGEA